MKWFRRTLSENRIFILTFLAVQFFYLVDGRNYVYAHQVYEQEEARLKEISELLGIPVEKLRPDHESLFGSLRKLFAGQRDPTKEAGLKRLREVLKKQEEELAANPYLPRVEAVKREHAAHRIEGVLNDLLQLTEPPGGKALPEASQRALLRNLHYALQEDLTLPVPEGLPAKAKSKLATFQPKLDRLFESVRPVIAETQSPDMTGTLAQKIGQLKLTPSVEIKRSSREPRYKDQPLPLRRVEEKARTREVGAEIDVAAAPPIPGIREPSPPRVPSKAGIAPEIIELAESLDNSPAKIFTWVHDHVDFDPKWGAYKGPLGTLWERSGTSWDQAWLLRDLLVAAGVDARFEWGEIEIPTELLTNITGLDDPFRAGDLMTTAGVPIVLLTDGSRVVKARMSHVWVKAFVDYIPNRGATPGPGDKWIQMDPSLKRHTYAPGIPIHQDVAFSLGDYLLSGTELSPRRAHEEALWAYIRDHGIECSTLEQLKKAGSIVEEGFPFLPGTLRGKILSVDGEASEMPAAFQEGVRIEVRAAGGGALMGWEAALPALAGQRVELVYAGATADDQATLDSHGGVFETPPYLVDLKPVVKVGGVEQAAGGAIGSAEDVEVVVTLTPVNGAPDVLVHDGFAGEPSVLVTDFGWLPAQLLERYQAALAAAEAAGDEAEAELARLQLIGATYMHNLGRDLEDLAGWNWHRMVRILTEGLVAQTGSVTTTVGGEPLSFARAETFVDIAGMILGLSHTEGDSSFLRPTLELAGAQGSFLEGEIFNQVVEREGIAAVSALTRAQREGQALTRVDSTNVAAVLAAVDLGQDVEGQIGSAIGNGKIAWVPETPIDVNTWRGTGYVLEDPSSGAAAYLLSGGFAGGADTGRAIHILELVKNLLGDEDWLSGPFGSVVTTALARLRASQQPESGPETNHGDPINLANGNLWFTVHDYLIPALGLPIRWSRTYNSRSSYRGPLGYGWTFSYGERLEEQVDGSVLYREEDGSEHLFTPAVEGNGSFNRPPGKHLTLTMDASGYNLATLDGQVRHFAPTGHLLTITDPNGNIVTLDYDASDNLTAVVDAGGRQILTVTHTGGKITRVEDIAGRITEYEYLGDDLVRIKDVVDGHWEYSYDTDHNLVSKTNPLSEMDSYIYDSHDRCVGHVDALGQEERYAYSSLGERAVLTDARGSSSFLEFDERGRAVLDVSPLGSQVRSTWDEDNNRAEIVDSRGGVTSRTFDSNGNTLSITNALGETATYTYDPQFNKVQTATGFGGHTTTYAYDGSGNRVLVSRQEGAVELREEYAFDSSGLMVESRDPNGNSTLYDWDSQTGSLLSAQDPNGDTIEFASDDLGRLSTITGPQGLAMSLTWADNDRATSLTDPLGATTIIEYDALGRRTSLTNNRGTTLFEYDAVGRQISSTNAIGASRRSEYDAAGNVVGVVDPRGNKTTLVYDALGRQIATIDPGGNVWSYEFCADLGEAPGGQTGCENGSCQRGELVQPENYCQLTDPLGNTVNQDHDALGRVVRRQDPLGHETFYEYNASGQISSVTDALGRVTAFEYDEVRRLAAVVEADGSRTEYSYDKSGNLLTIRDAEDREWGRTYDKRNRVKSETDPEGRTRLFSYDALGNLISRTEPNSDEITFDYNLNLREAIHLPGGLSETFSYDATGRRVATSNQDISLAFAYDDLGRPTAITDQRLSRTLAYTYDSSGNITAVVGPLGQTDYFYDANDRLTEIEDPNVGRFSIEYDARGRRTRLRYANGTETVYEYDAAGRLLSLVTRNQRSGEILDGYSYEYDAVGNRVSAAALHSGATDVYEYDNVNQLTRWQRGAERFEEFQYDLVGNRIQMTDQDGTTSYQYDDADFLLNEQRTLLSGGTLETTYSWGPNGNLLQKTSGSGTTVFDYDPLNRLVSIDENGAVTSFGYSPDGLRVREDRDGDSRLFLYSLEDIVGVYDGSGDLVTYRVHGPGIDEPLVEVQSGVASYLHHDGIGSITSVSDPTGSAVGSVSYAPFGGRESVAGATSEYGFTGREQVGEDLMYYRSRYYHTGIGRFIQRDRWQGSQEIPRTLNKYAYALNDPANNVDPWGFQSQGSGGEDGGPGNSIGDILACTAYIIFDLVLGIASVVAAIFGGPWGIALGIVVGIIAIVIAFHAVELGCISWKDLGIMVVLFILGIAAFFLHPVVGIIITIIAVAYTLWAIKKSLDSLEGLDMEQERRRQRDIIDEIDRQSRITLNRELEALA